MSLVAVLVASLLGSLHCAAMCGGFAAMCGGGIGARGKMATLLYSLGRGVIYVSFGLAAGSLGAGLDLAAEEWGGIQRAASIAMGVTLIAFGVWALRPRAPDPVPLISLGVGARNSWLDRARKYLLSLSHRPGPRAAFGVGLLAGLLPCGWLWSFLAVAGATADPMGGAATMAAFWLGTVPALLGIGFVARRLRSTIGPHAPRLVALVMIGLGVASLIARPADFFGTAEPEDDAPCHAPVNEGG